MSLKGSHLQTVHIDADGDDTGYTILRHLQSIFTAIHHHTVVLGGRVVDVINIKGMSGTHTIPCHTLFVSHIEMHTHRVHILRAVKVNRSGIDDSLGGGVQTAQTRIHIVGIDPCAVVAKIGLEGITRHVDSKLIGGTLQTWNKLKIIKAIGIEVCTRDTIGSSIFACHVTKVVALHRTTITHNTAHIRGRTVTIDIAHIITVLHLRIRIGCNTTYTCVIAGKVGVVDKVHRIVAVLDGTIVAVAHNTADIHTLNGTIGTAATDGTALRITHNGAVVSVVTKSIVSI